MHLFLCCVSVLLCGDSPHDSTTSAYATALCGALPAVALYWLLALLLDASQGHSFIHFIHYTRLLPLGIARAWQSIPPVPQMHVMHYNVSPRDALRVQR